jgi:hypothetical protein
MGAHPGFVFVLLAVWTLVGALVATAALVGLVQTLRAVRGHVRWGAVRRAIAWFVVPWLLTILGKFLLGSLFPDAPVRRALAVSMLLAAISAVAIVRRVVLDSRERSVQR